VVFDGGQSAFVGGIAAAGYGLSDVFANIPEKYITTKVLNRTDPAWRPFKGQLNARSQSYALQVIRSLYKALMDSGYMSINPFAALKSSALGAKRQAMDTTRTLHEEDLELVAKALAALPGLRSTSLAPASFCAPNAVALAFGVNDRHAPGRDQCREFAELAPSPCR
jgi:hypothetical protein